MGTGSFAVPGGPELQRIQTDIQTMMNELNDEKAQLTMALTSAMSAMNALTAEGKQNPLSSVTSITSPTKSNLGNYTTVPATTATGTQAQNDVNKIMQA